MNMCVWYCYYYIIIIIIIIVIIIIIMATPPQRGSRSGRPLNLRMSDCTNHRPTLLVRPGLGDDRVI